MHKTATHIVIDYWSSLDKLAEVPELFRQHTPYLARYLDLLPEDQQLKHIERYGWQGNIPPTPEAQKRTSQEAHRKLKARFSPKNVASTRALQPQLAATKPLAPAKPNVLKSIRTVLGKLVPKIRTRGLLAGV